MQEGVSGRGGSAGGCECRRGESTRDIQVWEAVSAGEC